MPYYISPPPQSPLTRIVAAIIAAFALVGAFIIGTAALLVVLAIGLVAGLALWLRVAWIKHQLKKGGFDLNAGRRTETRTDTGEVIDAEYTVISVKDRHDER
jgi:hypothetical protein